MKNKSFTAIAASTQPCVTNRTIARTQNLDLLHYNWISNCLYSNETIRLSAATITCCTFVDWFGTCKWITSMDRTSTSTATARKMTKATHSIAFRFWMGQRYGILRHLNNINICLLSASNVQFYLRFWCRLPFGMVFSECVSTCVLAATPNVMPCSEQTRQRQQTATTTINRSVQLTCGSHCAYREREKGTQRHIGFLCTYISY